MFIVYNVSGTIGLTFPGRRHYFFDIPIDIPTQRHLLLLYVAIMGHADPWIFSVSASSRLENSIDPREISIASTLC
jgi:hypothetical protein